MPFMAWEYIFHFSDIPDYISFYSKMSNYSSKRGNFNKSIAINETFSCVSSQVFYSIDKKRIIVDNSLYIPQLDHFPTYEEIKRDYPDKMVEKNGVHFVRVEPSTGQVGKKDRGKFIGTEYVIRFKW